jgi:hypothetical protein
LRDDAFAQGKSDAEVDQVFWRGEHDGVRDAVVNQGDRHFFCDGLLRR